MLYEEQYGQGRFLNLIRASTGNYQFTILIEQYRNRNVDTYLNSRCRSPLQFVMTELLNCAGMTNNRCVYVVVVFILYSKLKVMLC